VWNLKHSASKLHFTELKRKCLEIPQLRIYISVVANGENDRHHELIDRI